MPATVTFNGKFQAISVAFADGGNSERSARKIMQDLFGPEAGGRDGIAGSPRGRVMTEEDFRKTIEAVEQALKLEREKEISLKDILQDGVKDGLFVMEPETKSRSKGNGLEER